MEGMGGGLGANGGNYSLPRNRPAAILTTATSQRHRALLIDNDQPSSVSTSSSVVLPHNHECELPWRIEQVAQELPPPLAMSIEM